MTAKAYELHMCSTKHVLQRMAATSLPRFRVAMLAYVQPAVHMYSVSNETLGASAKGP